MQKFIRRFARLAGLCVLALALPLAAAAGAGRLTPARMAGGNRELGFWRIILPYGQEESPAPKMRAFEETGELLHLVDEIRNALVRNPKTWTALKQIRNDLLRLDIDRVYDENPYFFSDAQGERALRIRGAWEGDRYEIALGEIPLLTGVKPRLGNAGAEIRFRRNPMFPDLVLAQTLAQVDLGTIQYREILESWEIFHQLLWLPHIGKENWLGYVKLPDRGFGPKLDVQDLEVASQWHGSFPHLASLLAQFLTVEDVVNTARQPVPDGPSQVRIVLRIDREHLARLFPEDFAALRFFIDRASFETTFLMPEGTHLAHISYDCDTHRVTVDFLTKDGGIVIADAAGFAVGETIYPTRVKKLDYRAMTHMKVNVYGLSMHFDDLPLEIHYEAPDPWEANERISRLVMQFREPPRVRAEGAFLYVMPPWFIDLLLPGTLEGLLRDFFAMMTAGNGGRGIYAGLDFLEEGGAHRVDADLSLELPYQLLGPVVRDIINREWTDPATRPGNRPKLLLEAVRNALREDFEAVDPRSSAPGVQAPLPPDVR